MPTTYSSEYFPEKGTRILNIVFTDEDGNLIIPNTGTIKWSLTTKPLIGTAPVVINGREDVVVTSASTINVVLKGDDLAILSDELSCSFVDRLLTLEYEYDSSLGTDLPDGLQFVFPVENFFKKT